VRNTPTVKRRTHGCERFRIVLNRRAEDPSGHGGVFVWKRGGRWEREERYEGRPEREGLQIVGIIKVSDELIAFIRLRDGDEVSESTISRFSQSINLSSHSISSSEEEGVDSLLTMATIF
jgi:hypothetical protein